MKKINILYIFLFISKIAFSQNKLTDEDYNTVIEQHREKYITTFLTNPKSPIKKEDIGYVHFFKPKQDYNIEATVTKAENEQPFDLATSSGKTKQFIKYGYLKFTIDKKEIQLAVYQNFTLINNPLYKDFLFLPFKDLSNGETTYGGGRYIDLKATDIINGKLWIDFNKAYNPYCAFALGYNCPVPPKENHLKIKIEVGEQNFGKTHD
jgi:uncharacterized protein